MVRLLSYLNYIKDNHARITRADVSTVQEYFRSVNPPFYDIYNMFTDKDGLDSTVENNVITGIAYGVEAIHAVLDDELTSTTYGAEITDHFTATSKRFEDIYSRLLSNIHSKSTESIVHLRDAAFNMDGVRLLPLVVSDTYTTASPEITVSGSIVSPLGIGARDTDASVIMGGIFKDYSPYAKSVEGDYYYESKSPFIATVSLGSVSSNQRLIVTMIDGTTYTGGYGEQSIVISAIRSEYDYYVPFIVSLSSGAKIETNSYVALEFDASVSTGLSDSVKAYLKSYTIYLRSTMNALSVYRLGVASVSVRTTKFATTTTYTTTAPIPTGATYVTLIDSTVINGANVIVDGFDISDKSELAVTGETASIQISMGGAGAYIDNLGIVFK